MSEDFEEFPYFLMDFFFFLKSSFSEDKSDKNWAFLAFKNEFQLNCLKYSTH